MSSKKRIEYNICIFIHNMVIGKRSSFLKIKIEVVGMDGRVQTRQKGNIQVERCKTREEEKMLL